MSEPPRVTSDPWEKVDEWSETALDVPFITVEATNAVYEDPEFLEAFRPLMRAQLDQTPRAVFTTGLSLDPDPPGDRTPAAVLDIAGRYASREFETSLREDGLAAVEQTGSKELRLSGRRTAKAFQYDADYPLDADALGTPRADPTLRVRVWAAIWPTQSSFGMGGGIYPLEGLAAVVDRVGADSPDVTVEARPGGDRRVVFDCLREAAE